MRAIVRSILTCVCSMLASGGVGPQPPATAQPSRTGADVYRTACASCHGSDGRGAPAAAIGRTMVLPDFTDCSLATPEADADWMAVVHEGGPARAFDRMMPSFTEALSANEIESVVGHLRTFCTNDSWPRGNLNLPRPLVTEKAFPENEAVVTTTVNADAVGNRFVYERRVGSRGQVEVAVPIDAREASSGGWSAGIGDVAVAYKHAILHSLRRGPIVSAGRELVLPTGR